MGRKYMESKRNQKSSLSSSKSVKSIPAPAHPSQSSFGGGGLFDSFKQGLGFGVGTEVARQSVNNLFGGGDGPSARASSNPTDESSLNSIEKEVKKELKENCQTEKRGFYQCVMDEEVFSCDQLMNEYRVCMSGFK